MKISVVVPAYNEEKLIGQCLSTTLSAASGFDVEVIVVDNASTDATSRIASTFPGVKIVLEKTQGVLFARQRGFQESTGDIVAFIDADSKVPIQWFHTICTAFIAEDIACLSGPYFYYDVAWWHTILVKVWYLCARVLYMMTGYMLTAGNCAVRRNVLEKIGGWDTSIVFYGDDTDLARRAHRCGKVLFTKDFYMMTSGRRLLHMGILKTAFLYGINYFSVVIFNRPCTSPYKAFR